ncbi:MAG: hypothetical protein HC898_02335 [Phycisphaerales bacterium]|nr:hypothetical protein [Phycisphaerales bacterium]
MMQIYKAIPLLIVEFNPRQAQQAGVQADAFIRRLLRLAPQHHAWVVETGHHLTDLSPQSLTTLGQCNLRLMPGNKSCKPMQSKR